MSARMKRTRTVRTLVLCARYSTQPVCTWSVCLGGSPQPYRPRSYNILLSLFCDLRGSTDLRWMSEIDEMTGPQLRKAHLSSSPHKQGKMAVSARSQQGPLEIFKAPELIQVTILFEHVKHAARSIFVGVISEGRRCRCDALLPCLAPTTREHRAMLSGADRATAGRPCPSLCRNGASEHDLDGRGAGDARSCSTIFWTSTSSGARTEQPIQIRKKSQAGASHTTIAPGTPTLTGDALICMRTQVL